GIRRMNRSASTSSSLPREQKAEARVASLQDGASWRPAMLVYGLGGVLLPFAAIKLIDLLLVLVFGA
ncbi:hypothetical protein C7E12_20135, partial [Stenotrophomonas maltophilia]